MLLGTICQVQKVNLLLLAGLVVSFLCSEIPLLFQNKSTKPQKLYFLSFLYSIVIYHNVSFSEHRKSSRLFLIYCFYCTIKKLSCYF